MDPEVQKCPFRAYDEVRKVAPVYKDPMVGWYFVTGYDLVRSLTGDTGNLSNNTGFLFNRQSQNPDHQHTIDKIWREEGFPRVPALVVVDPPNHAFHRAFIESSFTPARVQKIEAYLESIVDEMIDGFVDHGEVDFKSKFATMVPLAVIADQLGMPRSDLDRLHVWSDAILDQLDVSISDEKEIELTKTICALHRYTAAKVEEYRKAPRECLLSDFANMTIDDRQLSMPEIAAMVSQVLSGGNDSTANALASGMLRLIEQPDLQSRLREEPALIPAFIEEVLRLDAPVQGLFRRALCDLEMGGVTIPEGSLVVLKWGAANRDPGQFPNPEVLDLGRANARRHMTFGFGPHTCIGAQLTRGEMRVSFTQLLKRLGNIRLSPKNPLVEHPAHFFSYGLDELHIAFKAL